MRSSDERSIDRRSLLRLALAAPVVPGLVMLPTVNTVARPRPVAPAVQQLRLDGDVLRPLGAALDGPGRPSRWGESSPAHLLGTGPIGTSPFRMLGLTWTADAPALAFQVRTRGRRRRQWSEWQELYDDRHAPDPGTAEATSARRGTDAVVVDEADAVQVRVTAAASAPIPGLRVELIDLGESSADGVDESGAAARAAETARPDIHTRADWGADESLREQTEPKYGAVRGMFVHHTAGSNTYDKDHVPGIIRGIYAYHVNGRGWRDIGYNFLIDRFGRIWEGRYGGMTEAVVGAHTLGYNSYAFAAAVLGTYTPKAPEAAVLQAYEDLITWKFGLHGVGADEPVAYPDLETLHPISGHRDGGATECPGDQLYAELATIRAGVSGAQRSAS